LITSPPIRTTSGSFAPVSTMRTAVSAISMSEDTRKTGRHWIRPHWFTVFRLQSRLASKLFVHGVEHSPLLACPERSKMLTRSWRILDPIWQ
jgi:hypothetical protein